MNFELQHKIALVVGGSSGIGLASAALLAAEGAQLIIAGRDADKGQSAVAQLGGQARFWPCDITRADSVTALFRHIEAEHGRLDVAVNSAAIPMNPGLLHEVDDSAAAELLQTDVYGQFLCLKQEIALMRQGGGGAIVNVSSTNGLSGTAQAALYSAGRHAVLGLTRSAALEAIAHNIRINAVCPGATDTPRRAQRVRHLDAATQADIRARTAAAIPIGRIATADEIAQAIVWLCSPRSSYVVGHALAVDGGLSA